MKQWLKPSLLMALSLLLVLSLTACDDNTGSRYTDDNDDDGITIPSLNLDLNDIVTIHETALVNNDIATITAESLSYNNGTAVLKLSIDNHSDNDIDVTLGGCAVNGITMNDVTLHAQVDAGTTASKSVSFSDLGDHDILAIKNFTFVFHCYDHNSSEPYFTTSPLTLTTTGAELYTQTYDNSGTKLFEKDDIQVLFQRLDYPTDNTSEDGAKLWLYIDNKNDINDMITMSIHDLSVNNHSIEHASVTAVMPQSVAVACIHIAQSELDANGITSIDQLELSLEFADSRNHTIGTSDLLRITFS